MNRAMIPLMAIPAAMSFFFAFLLLALPVWALAHGATSLELGYLGAIGSLVYFLSVPFTGRLSDRYDPRRISTWAAFLFAAAAAAVPSTRTLGPLYGLVAVYSLALALFWPALESQLAHVLHTGKLSQRAGFYNISWSSGIGLGTVTAGYIFDLSPTAPFYLAAGGAALLPSLFLIFPSLDHAADQGDRPQAEPAHPAAHPVHLLISRISTLCFWFALGILRSLFPKLALTLNFNATWIGILLASLNLAMSSLFLLFAYTSWWHFRHRLLALSQALAIIGMGLIALGHRAPLLLLGFMLAGICSAHSYSASLYYALYFSKKPGQEEPSTVGHNTGLHEFFIGVGGFLGPLLGGPAARYLDLRAPYLLAGGVILVGMMVGWVLRIRASRRPPEIRTADPGKAGR